MTASPETSYDALLQPLPLGSRTAPSRIIFASHQTNFATHHRFEKRHAAYYGARAAGGAGVIVLEGSIVHPSDWPYEYIIRGWEPEVVDSYRLMADVIRRHGALVFAHLTHSGMQGSSHYSQLPLWAPSPVPDVVSREMPQEMDGADIDDVVEGFRLSARHVAEAGLDGVEINAGQNSLIRQFLSPLTNHRQDHYGGDPEYRLRFARKVIKAVREEMGERVVGLRLCGDEHAPWAGLKPEDAAGIAALLAADGQLDFIAVTTGSIFTSHLTRPGLYMPPGFALGLAGEIKHAVSLPVFAQGSIVDPPMAAAALAEGRADAVEMTRALIADPRLPAKLRNGAPEQVRPCTLCNQACVVAQVQNPRLSCTVNPAAGYEGTAEFAPLTRAPIRHRVMVVGAGPAGLEAARVAAERGHSVTVVERDDRIGGAVRHAMAAPGRERLGLAAEWLAARLRALDVPVRTGVEATPALVRDEAPEAVIVAVGSVAGHDPALIVEPGAPLRSPREVMAGDVPETPGKAVLLDGMGDQVGMGVAEWLADRGWKVDIVTADMFHGQRLAPTNELTPWNQRACAKGINLLPQIDVARVTKSSVVGADHFDKKPVEIGDVDLVVGIVPEMPDEELYFALKESGSRVFRAGDCMAPRAIGQAILEGYRAGREV